jgi:hypothetical protein
VSPDWSVGTLVVRAWAGPESGAQRIRARVLAITGPEAETREVGAAAGVAAILDLVAEGLRTVLPGEDDDVS